MLRKRSVILAKTEITTGVDAVPTAALNAILAFDLEISITAERIERDPSRPTLSPYPHLIGRRYREITFQTELRSSGLSHTTPIAPRTGDLFEACGMLETLTAEIGGDGLGSVVYTPISDNHTTATIYAFIDGVHWKLLGCNGSWEIIAESGQPARVNWTFQGTYEDQTDLALPSPVTYDDPVPPLTLSSGFQINADTTLIAQQLSIGIGNNIVMRDDINAAAGYAASRITARAGSGSFNPEVVSVASYDFEREWRDAQQRALEISLGNMPGNRIKITAPNVQIDAPTHGDRDGIFTYDIPFFTAMNTGDDEIIITMT